MNVDGRVAAGLGIGLGLACVIALGTIVYERQSVAGSSASAHTAATEHTPNSRRSRVGGFVPARSGTSHSFARVRRRVSPSTLRPVRTADVVAVDEQNGIYVLAVGKEDDVREGDVFDVRVGDDEHLEVVVGYVLTKHASARRKVAKATTEISAALRDYGRLHETGRGFDAVVTDGTVTAIEKDGERFVLSVGTEVGVEVGVEFTVHRDGEYIATVVVTRAVSGYCTARAKEGLLRKPPRVGDGVSTIL